jgi:putative Holliday junction resolvase
LVKYLGIDYGSARVGLATANSDAKLASPLKTVTPDKVAAEIAELLPDVIVVGLPRSLDGRETPQTLAVRRYTDDVLDGLSGELVFQDEAGTSSVAEDRLKESGRKYAREDIDAEAAAIILQDYLDSV